MTVVTILHGYVQPVVSSLLFFLSSPWLASAQTDPTDKELVRQLLQRVIQLEAQLKELKPPQTQAPPQAATPEPAPAPAEAHAAEFHDHDAALSASRLAQAVTVRGFVDVGYTGSNPAGTSSFGWGQVDLFASARISTKVKVVMEAVLEADSATNSQGLDMERVLLQYRHNDYLNVEFGRYHTLLQHGLPPRQMVPDRGGSALHYQFEDKGGLLPVHNVGVSVTGRVPYGRLGLQYAAEIGNGRSYPGAGAEPVQNVRDENNGKAVNIALLARPEFMPGWQFGASAYRDRLARDGFAPVRQYIFSGHAVFIRGRVEFLNEAVWMRHSRQEPGGRQLTTSVPAAYSQFAYRVAPAWRPYVRYEYLNSAVADPVAGPILGNAGWRRELTAGVRYDIAEFVALKLQYQRLARKELPTFDFAVMNLSFTF